MTDSFALLGFARQPWIGEEALKHQFHAFSRQVHPDHVHHLPEEARSEANSRSVALNNAFTRLSSSKERLAHLLELECGSKPEVVQAVPEDLMSVCMDVGAVCRKADAFLAESATIDSPLLKAARFGAALELQDEVNALISRLRSQVEAVETVLQSLNPLWIEQGREAERPYQRIEELWRLLSYLNRWTSQLQERSVRLSI